MSLSEDNYYERKFAKLSLEKEAIRAKTFEQCEFDGCIFVDCKFEKCRFIDCKFSECVLSAIDPIGSRFSDVTFAKSKVIGFDWTKTQEIRGLAFNSCQVNYSNFRLLKLDRIKMLSCEAKEVSFIETDLSNGDFRNTDFEQSRFFKTDLSGADFRGARNYFIDVKNNVLTKARFSLPEALALLNGLGVIID